MVIATEDDLVDNKTIEEVYSKLPDNPHSELKIYQGFNHRLHLTGGEREVFVADSLAFLNRICPNATTETSNSKTAITPNSVLFDGQI